MTPRALAMPDIRTRLGKRGRTSVYRDIQRGILPPLISLGPRRSGMLEHELDAIIKARAGGATEDELRRLVAQLVAERQNGAHPLRAA